MSNGRLLMQSRCVGKKLPLILAVFVLLYISSVNLFAEADNGAFLPDTKDAGAQNIYIQVEPLKLQFPMFFVGFDEEKAFSGMLTNVGYAINGEIGYNWSGWLFGAHVGYAGYAALNDNNKNLVKEFDNLTVGFNLSRVLSSKTFKSLPSWLSFTPTIGVGVDLYKAQYYRSKKQQLLGNLTKVNFGERLAVYIHAALQTDFYLGTDYAIPFISIEGNIVPDKDGISFFSGLSVGLRSYPFSALGSSRVWLSTASKTHTPEGEDEDGIVNFLVSSRNLNPDAVKDWKLNVYDEQNNLVKTLVGKGMPPKSIIWDGLTDNGEPLKSGSVYKTELRLNFDNDETTSAKGSIKTTGEKSFVQEPAVYVFAHKTEDKADNFLDLNLETDGLTKEEEKNLKEWHVAIQSPDGTLLKEWKGNGALPEKLHWDGKDSEGNLVSPDIEYNTKADVTLANGKTLADKTLVATVERKTPPSLKMKAVSTGAKNSAQSHAADFSFDKENFNEDEVKYWEIRIADEKGRVVRTLKGKGMPPKNVRWDGKDDKGKTVLAQSVYSVTSDIALKDGSHGLAKTSVKTGAPSVGIKMATNEITPDGDGKNDTAKLILRTKGLGKENVKAWSVLITDAKGRVVRNLKGKGMPPKTVSWDGKDDTGKAVLAGSTYSVASDIELKDGSHSKAKTKLKVGAPTLRMTTPAKGFSPDGDGKNDTAPIAFDRSGLSEENVDSWIIGIYNAKGKRVRTLKGKGVPPANLSWDGRDENGDVVPENSRYTIKSDITLKDGSHGKGEASVNTGKMKDPEIVLKVLPENFTPDGDGVNDTAEFKVVSKNGVSLKDTVKGWKLSIYDPKGALFREMKGKGLPPKDLAWDGKGENGESVLSVAKYRSDMQVFLKNGNTVRKSTDIDTGVLVTKLPGGRLQIQVTSIFFDPSAATFKRITKDQKRTNERTLTSVAKVIKKFKGYHVDVEGHANNVSGTEREDRTELIPLSQERAEKIVEELAKRGVDKKQMTAIGKGGKFPIVKRSNKKQWWKNRRVEFILTK